MNYRDLTKKVVTFVVGAGISKIVHDVIANNVDTSTIASKATVGSASVVVGMAMSDVTASYTDAKIDEIADWWEKKVTNRPK